MSEPELDWVISEERGVRWFIPEGGIGDRTADELIAEAFSMRTENEKRMDSRRAVKKRNGRALLSCVTVPLDLAMILGGGLGGVAVPEETFLTPKVWD